MLRFLVVEDTILFSIPYRKTLGPAVPPAYRELLSGLKRTGCGADHSPPHKYEAENS